MFECSEDIRENADDDDDATNIKIIHISLLVIFGGKHP